MRKVREETGLVVEVDMVVDSRVYPVLPDRSVVIVTYRCHDLGAMPPVTIGDEHREGRWVPVDDCLSYRMPSGYLRSIQACTGAGRPAAGQPQ